MAHLTDLLEHAKMTTHGGCLNNVEHQDAVEFIQMFGQVLSTGLGQWSLGANYLRFRQEKSGAHLITHLLASQPPAPSLNHQGVQSARRSWQLIHSARSTLPNDSSLSAVVTGSIAKRIATYHWPQPVTPATVSTPAPNHDSCPGLCGFWLLEASCFGLLSQLSEQLVQDVLFLAECGTEACNNEWVQRYAGDFEAVDGVLRSALNLGLQPCTAFQDFFRLWKSQLRLLAASSQVACVEHATFFSSLVVQVLETEQVPRRHWVSMLRFIVVPLMSGQWRGKVFDSTVTSYMMHKLEQAAQLWPTNSSGAQQDLLSDLRFVLNENLSAANIFANEICC
eukprot:TRINITY_DN25950_c0_g1_i2.p1 TRINITY_DN25950_c0_g1~~TRINITY_DN25950_c0_g1_i2.p1  ORF type:complete len:337 (-),score=79.30 TRINITY_DN25950_c0_g1_i2:329-1339(-)